MLYALTYPLSCLLRPWKLMRPGPAPSLESVSLGGLFSNMADLCWFFFLNKRWKVCVFRRDKNRPFYHKLRGLVWFSLPAILGCRNQWDWVQLLLLSLGGLFSNMAQTQAYWHLLPTTVSVYCNLLHVPTLISVLYFDSAAIVQS